MIERSGFARRQGYFERSPDDENEYCSGFEEGYKSVAGDFAATPACPDAPATPAGSMDFREGLKDGMEAAKQG
ncbi:hypothetical protein D3C81_1829380 [compost metagenome]